MFKTYIYIPMSQKILNASAMQIEIEKITPSNYLEAVSFLEKDEDTSIFLLGNFKEYGP